MPTESSAGCEEGQSVIFVQQKTLIQFNAILVETSLNADEQLHQFFQIYQCIKTTLTLSQAKKKVNCTDYFLSQLQEFKRYVLSFNKVHGGEVETFIPSTPRYVSRQHPPHTDITKTVVEEQDHYEADDGNVEDNAYSAAFESPKKEEIYLSPTIQDNQPSDKTFINTDSNKVDRESEESMSLTLNGTVQNKEMGNEETESRSDKMDKKFKKLKRKRKETKEQSVENVTESLEHVKIKRERLPDFPHSQVDDKVIQTRSVVRARMVMKKKRKKIASFNLDDSTTSKEVAVKVMCKMEKGNYVCEHCNYKTTRKYNMERHTFKHSEQPVCRICNTTFVDSFNLKTHMVHTHGRSGDAKACCSQCGENFFSLNALRRHKQFVHQRKAKYHCKTCDMFFDSGSRFDAHMSKHTGIVPHHCEKCGKGYRFKKNLTQHAVMCTANYIKILRKFRCCSCSYSTTRKFDITNHCEKHKQRTYTCKDCKISFETRQGLQRHLNLNHKKQACSFPCPVCNNVYGLKSELEEHMHEHPGNWLHHCPKCSKGFSKQEYLSQHLKRCGQKRRAFIENDEYGKEGKQFFCKLCSYKTEWCTSMKRHRFTHVTVGKPTCHICGKAYCCEGDLRDHVNVAHANAKFLCSQCGKEFSCRSSLLRHTQVTHELKYKYECDVCPQRFTDKRKMADHMDKHSGARNHICHICGMAYRYRPRLAVHLRRHQNPEPVQCEYCKSSFKNSDTLRVHIMGKHLDRKYPCPFCGKDFIWHKSMSHHKKNCRSRPRDVSNDNAELGNGLANIPQGDRPPDEDVLDERMATDMVIEAAAAAAIKTQPPSAASRYKVYRLHTYSPPTPQNQITLSNISGLPITNLSSIPMSQLPNLSVPTMNINGSMSNFVNLTDVTGSTLTNLSVPGLSSLPVATFSNLPATSMAELSMAGMSNGQTSSVSNLTMSNMSNLSVSTMSNETITTLSNVPVSSLTSIPLHLSNVPVSNMSNLHVNLAPSSLHSVVTQSLPVEWKVDATHIPVYAKDY